MFNNIINHKFLYEKNLIEIEIGRFSRQSTSSLLIKTKGTVLLVSVVIERDINDDKKDFFPLTVFYQEKFYAVGRIPGNFFRREGRPTENEIIISRLIDRSIRPLFESNFFHETQIIVTALSIDSNFYPDILSLIGVSAALSIIDIPFKNPIGAARVGLINKKYILNPTDNDLKSSCLNLVVSGTKDSIIMVESESSLLSEDQILNAIEYGHLKQQVVVNNILELKNKFKKDKFDWVFRLENSEFLYNKIVNLLEDKLIDAYLIQNRKKRLEIINNIKKRIIQDLVEKDKKFEISEINKIIFEIEKNIFRKFLIKNKFRVDGRHYEEIRSVDVQINILPMAHGSSLFTRGETQSLVSITLGMNKDSQNLDKFYGENINRFIFHYNFPSYATGDIGSPTSPKRREIGHGYLSKNSLKAVMPNYISFPYIIRVVSEITESNGSSSMASVCGASLALMDAGVPIKELVAGVAMGLIKDYTSNSFIILSDISGEEDHFGDMDFKVAGTKNGISALQMDLKISGIKKEIISLVLKQAKKARLDLIKKMERLISSPRKEVSKFAPKVFQIEVSQEKIKDIIGKGGSVIRCLMKETKTTIDIIDNNLVEISSYNKKDVESAVEKIKDIILDIRIGGIYKGKIIRIVDFGIFVSLSNSKEGLVHISEISNNRASSIHDHFHLNQKVFVKVLDIDFKGRLKLSIKGALKYNKKNKKL